MKDIKLFIPILLIVSCMGLQAQQNLEERKVILIDPGHGGVDRGTISEDGLREKDVVLDIAQSMIKWNRDLLDSQFDIYLTRSIDTLISLDDRTRLARHLKPDVFISLHCNHFDNPKVKGVEFYTYENNQQTIKYALAISDKLSKKLGLKTSEPNYSNFQVLRESVGYGSAFLLELGYLSNTDESEYLKNIKNRKVLALAILMTILEVSRR